MCLKQTVDHQNHNYFNTIPYYIIIAGCFQGLTLEQCKSVAVLTSILENKIRKNSVPQKPLGDFSHKPPYKLAMSCFTYTSLKNINNIVKQRRLIQKYDSWPKEAGAFATKEAGAFATKEAGAFATKEAGAFTTKEAGTFTTNY